jgi:hypothetical protein
MRRRTFLAWMAGAGTLAASGCATVADDPRKSLRDTRAERGTGVIVNYAAPYDQVWSALAAIMKELGLKIAGDNKAEGYMLAETGAAVFSRGERIAVFVERIGTAGNTRVEVVSKRAAGMNAAASDWAPKIHEKLGQRFRRL